MSQQSLDPTYPLFPICSFLGFVLCLVPLPWHLQAWNAGTCAFMLWTSSACLVGFVNSMIWVGNVDNVAPVWCDISTQIILGASIGIPCSILCISRRLYTITSVQTASVTKKDKIRSVIVDICIALGFPIIILILHIVVHPHRFDIFEGVGCFPVTYNTLPAYFLYYMWPPIIGSISFVYSCLTLRSFWRRRVQFSQLVSKTSTLNPSRFFRLMLLAVLDICCTVPLSVHAIVLGTKGVTLAPWISWEETHWGFSRVDAVAAKHWRSSKDLELGIEFARWLPVLCAITFVALFGFAQEAQKHYKQAFWWCAGLFGVKPSAKTLKQVLLPSWVKPPSTPIKSDVYPLSPVSPSNKSGYKTSPPPQYSVSSSIGDSILDAKADGAFQPLSSIPSSSVGTCDEETSRPSTPVTSSDPISPSPLSSNSTLRFSPSSPRNARPYSYPLLLSPRHPSPVYPFASPAASRNPFSPVPGTPGSVVQEASVPCCSSCGGSMNKDLKIATSPATTSSNRFSSSWMSFTTVSVSEPPTPVTPIPLPSTAPSSLRGPSRQSMPTTPTTPYSIRRYEIGGDDEMSISDAYLYERDDDDARSDGLPRAI